MPNVVAVIPALNEERAIGAVVQDLPRDLVGRIMVVDNGSSDGTAAAATAAGAEVVREPRRGYGRACLAGMAAAPKADIYLFLDGDYSDYPEEARAVLAPILEGRADVVLGSRTLGRRERGALTLQARFGNRLAALLIRVLDGVTITDLAPFKAIRGDLARSLHLREMTYGWTIEIIVLSAQAGARIQQVPVSYRRRLAGESKVSGNLRAAGRAGACIVLTLLRLHLRGNRRTSAMPVWSER